MHAIGGATRCRAGCFVLRTAHNTQDELITYLDFQEPRDLLYPVLELDRPLPLFLHSLDLSPQIFLLHVQSDTIVGDVFESDRMISMGEGKRGEGRGQT